MSLAVLWLAGSAAALAPAPVIATDSTAVAPPQVRATRLVRPIVIDGVLHDVMWKGAERVPGFLQRDPMKGRRRPRAPSCTSPTPPPRCTSARGCATPIP